MAERLSTLDYVVVAAYLAVTLALGLAIGRRVRSGTDFFLAGRRLPWWAVGMSLVATDIGGTDLIGVGGAAYTYGLAVGNFEWIGCVPAMIVAAFVFVPFLYFSVWAFLVTLGLVIVIGWMTRPEPASKIARLLYHRPGGSAP